MLQPTALTETEYLKRRSNLERQVAAAEHECDAVAYEAAMADDDSVALDALSRVETLKKKLHSLDLAWRQSGRMMDAADDDRRKAARIEMARNAKAADMEAAVHAAKIQSLATELKAEVALYRNATAKSLSLAFPLSDRKGLIRDLLQPVAFSTSPEEAWFAGYIHQLGFTGILALDGRGSASAFGDKAFDDVFRTHYAKIRAIIEGVLAELLAEAA